MSIGYITTYTGKHFSHVRPTLESIDIEDIAHALSNLCHWGGHVKQFFSIAQHCVLVSTLCPPHLKKWGLMHDAAEAYCGDMTRPLKVLLPQYKEIEKKVMRRIAAKYELSWPEPADLKFYDNQALAVVARRLMTNYEKALHDGFGNPLDMGELPEVDTFPLQPRVAKEAFLSRFHGLFL